MSDHDLIPSTTSPLVSFQEYPENTLSTMPKHHQSPGTTNEPLACKTITGIFSQTLSLSEHCLGEVLKRKQEFFLNTNCTSDNTVDQVLVLHVANRGLILSKAYDPPSPASCDH